MRLKNNQEAISIGVVDDQQLFLRSICALIDSFPGFTATVDALRGEDMLTKLSAVKPLPDIILVDVSMPEMDGITTARKINSQYPTIRLVALSTKDDDLSIIDMLRAGCSAYLVKDIHPDELETALQEVYSKGFYNDDAVNVDHRRKMADISHAHPKLSEKERVFLQLACSDLTYKQIAGQMYLSERTIDGYRESLFDKMKVQSRVGMVLEGLRMGFISL